MSWLVLYKGTQTSDTLFLRSINRNWRRRQSRSDEIQSEMSN
jgi:hypothetical protein